MAILRNLRLAVVLAGVAVTAASGSTIYGLATSGTTSYLYTLDAAGTATKVAATVSGVYSSGGDIDFLDSVLYATNVRSSGAWTFGTVDVSTGAYTKIATQGGSSAYTGLAANAALGSFYIWNGDTQMLYSLSKTGVATAIGSYSTGIGIYDLAYDPVGGILYGVSGSTLYTISTSSGGLTAVGNLGVSSATMGLAFDATTGKLYLNKADSAQLYTVNTATGLATLTGSNAAAGINALAVLQDTASSTATAPEATTGSFLAGGLAVILFGRVRRRKA
jgi:hypothetical protein